MTRTSFNRGWRARSKVNSFLESVQEHVAQWEDVTLPHDAMQAVARDPAALDGPLNGYFPGGAFQYEKRFAVPADWRDKRVSLEFEGVYRDARVYLDHEFVGGHHSGWTGFVLPLDAFLRHGRTQTLSLECLALADGRKYTGAGIHRDVWLHVQELVHLAPDAVTVRTPDVGADHALVAVATTLLNESPHTASCSVRSEIRDPAGSVVGTDDHPVTVRAGATETVRQRILVAGPSVWGPDSPDLYAVATTLSRDGAPVEGELTTFGIRTLAVDPVQGLRVNGETVLLRGACLHAENGPLGAATIRRADERRVELLRDAGFNALRIGHQSMSTAMLDACDRLGMLVLDEAFDSWVSAKADSDFSLYFPDYAVDEISRVVRKDRNRPSVVMFAVGNEVSEAGRPLDSGRGRRVAEAVRALDGDRFTVNCINGLAAIGPYLGGAAGGDDADSDGGESDGPDRDAGADPMSGGLNSMMNGAGGLLAELVDTDLVTERTAEAFAAVDIGGYNYMEGRYDHEAARFPNRVMVGSETGRRAFAENWRHVLDLPNLIGDFCWSGWDYLGEVGIGRALPSGADEPLLREYPWLAGSAGDIDITGHRLACSYWREVVYGRRTGPWLGVQRPHGGKPYEPAMWAWTDAVPSWTWDVPTGTAVFVEVYSADESTELTLNGRSVGTAVGGAANGFRDVVEVPWEPGELVATSASGARTVLSTPTGTATLRATADRPTLRADDFDLAVVVVELVDDHGRVFTTRGADVTVTVTGPAVLQALASGDPAPTVGFRESTCPTWDGRVTAYVRPTASGGITVTATAAAAAGRPETSTTLELVSEPGADPS